MIIGDSFSAFKEGYSRVLHDSLPDYNIRNVSVSGTSIREQFLFGRHYLKKAKPDVLIFQFYVGNDFIGWDHPLNWKELSWARNVYWGLSEHFWSLAYLNYQLAVVSSKKADHIPMAEWSEQAFSSELYAKHDKRYFKAEPMLVENAAYLKGGRETNFEDYMDRVADLLDYAGEECEIYFLIIPHASQVSNEYKQRSEQLGAIFSEDFGVGDPLIPLNLEITDYFADDTRVKILNPLTMFAESENEGDPIYFNNDSHLNWRGQQLLGEFILSYLIDNENNPK